VHARAPQRIRDVLGLRHAPAQLRPFEPRHGDNRMMAPREEHVAQLRAHRPHRGARRIARRIPLAAAGDAHEMIRPIKLQGDVVVVQGHVDQEMGAYTRALFGSTYALSVE